MSMRMIFLGFLFVGICHGALAFNSAEATPVRHIWGDMDKDGLSDLFVLDAKGNKLFRNLGQAGFEDVTVLYFAGGAGCGGTGIFGDYDCDGSLDLVLFNEKGLTLFQNHAGQRFIDVTETSGLDKMLEVTKARLVDIDQDGYEDLLVETPTMDRIFYNRYGVEFEEIRLPGVQGNTGYPVNPGVQKFEPYPVVDDPVDPGCPGQQKVTPPPAGNSNPGLNPGQPGAGQQPGSKMIADNEEGMSFGKTRVPIPPSRNSGPSTLGGMPPMPIDGEKPDIDSECDKAFTWTDPDWNYWSNSPHMYSIPSGNVGIGVSNPGHKLDVGGDFKVSGPTTLANSVTVNGPTTLNDSAKVNGPATFNSPVTVNASLQAQSLSVSSSSHVTNLNADLLDGIDSGAFSQFGSLVETHELQNQAVTVDKLGDDAVTRPKIGASAVGVGELDNNSVSTDKIQDLAVTRDKIASGAVGVGEICTNGVESAEIADNAVGSSELASGLTLEGTTTLNDDLNVWGDITCKGLKLIQFKRVYVPGNSNVSTGYPSSDWNVFVGSFHAGWGDIQEDDPGEIMRVWTYISGGMWRVRADFRSQDPHENWYVGVIAVRKEISSVTSWFTSSD